jgi:hypothetical protein
LCMVFTTMVRQQAMYVSCLNMIEDSSPLGYVSSVPR